MDRELTELESLAKQSIIGSTVELDLGVRSWSNVSPKVSASQLLYEDSWRKAYEMRTHSAKAAVTSKKGVALIAGGILAAAFGLSGVWLVQTPQMQSATASAEPRSEPHQVINSKDATALMSASSSGSASIPSATTEPISKPAAAAVASTAKPASTVIPHAGATMASPAQVSSSKPAVVTAVNIGTAKPLSAAPVVTIQGKRPEDFLPEAPSPIPAPAGRPGYVDERSEASEKSMLAVDETKAMDKDDRPAAAAPSPAVKTITNMVTQVEGQKPQKKNGAASAPITAAPAKESQRVVNEPVAKPEPVRAGPLARHTILAITSAGVVITDPSSKLPKEFKVGTTLPGGEIVKSVDQVVGQVVTDRRVLKISD